MDSEYDRKFEEMKKYIPFLENMIKRLESNVSGSNPRQAQLDKIRSLRDLLMDKKKRMKMENLLKCEQVLLNLYVKVEQRDSLPGSKNCDTAKKEEIDLNKVRSKLKSVVSKLHQDRVETLPEIARASDTEEICVPGSKEPALFQRRPNIPSTTLSCLTPSNENLSKRNYTRVLLSPERIEKPWSNEVSTTETPLFSRRSPKNSPRKRSPPYYKKERKKPSKNKLKYLQSKDLNITLNVPEDSLNSLNTKDILSRIINCNDNDVDIATLRELRTQILGELKETGANDDISDIILKSYKKKGKRRINSKEVEEGELSDSESEAIESIYGSLVVLDKNKSATSETKNSDNEKPRKIQICLVINSDNTKPVTTEENVNVSSVDKSDFEILNNPKGEKVKEESALVNIKTCEQNYDYMSGTFRKSSNEKFEKNLGGDIVENTNQNIEENVDTKNIVNPVVGKTDLKLLISKKCEENDTVDAIEISKTIEVPKLVDLDHAVVPDQKETKKESEVKLEDKLQSENLNQNKVVKDVEPPDDSNTKLDVEIPLLEPTKQVSEIDILQALKKEILSETTNVLNTDTSVSCSSTPPLHQPKITKVANAQEIGCKKRISIESYKAKTNTPSMYRPNSDITNNIVKEDNSRKQSLKLTEKECERFNFLSKLTLTESSDEEDKSSLSLDEIYTDLAPKSPDHDDFADTGLKPPVIIPSDRVQSTIVGSDTDVDMRKLLNVKPTDAPTAPMPLPHNLEKPQSQNFDKELNKCNERIMPLVDPRMKRDINGGSSQDTLNSPVTIDKTQRSIQNFVTTPVLHNVNIDMSSGYMQDNSNRHVIKIPTLQALSMTSNATLNISSNGSPNLNCPLISNVLPTNITQNTAQTMTPSIANLPLLMTPNRTSNVANMTPNRVPNIVANMTPSRTPNIVPNMTPNMTPSRHTFDNDDYSSQKHVYAPMFSIFETRDSIDNTRDNQQSQWDTRSDNRSPFWEDRNPKNSSVQRDIDYRESRPVSKDIDYRDQASNSAQREMDYRGPRSHSVQRDIDYRDRNFEKRDSENLQFSTTSNHSFSRLDCPPTPTASFGMLEMPMTPVHPFGRADCPLTPSHPFGRSEPLLATPTSFMRSEYNNQSVSRPQDPRLNRQSDYDSNQYRDDDRDGVFCHERFTSGRYKVDQSNRNNPELFNRYHREQSIGPNDRNKNYEPISRTYRDHMPRRDNSVSRSFNRDDRDCRYHRDYESDRFSRNRNSCGRGYDYRSYNDPKIIDDGGRRSHRREKNIGTAQETFSNKDRKPGSKFGDDNKLSIQSHGRNIIAINTSINSTFQNNNRERKFSSSFDARRQRASSVGRVLVSDAKKYKSCDTKQIFNDTEKRVTNSKNFRRACSVGRETEDNKRNFTEIKADLKSFKFKSDVRFSKESTTKDRRRNPIEYTKSGNYRDEKKTAEFYDSKYSPRKNNRDPRMRRENSRDNNDHKSSSRDSKNYGIVYSNDNISKGTILGSGYGVKNYKIPKIRRSQEVIETNKTTDNAGIDEAIKSTKNKQSKETKQNDVKILSETEIKLQKSEKKDSSPKISKLKDIENNKNNDKIFQNDKNKKQTGNVANVEYIESEKTECEVSSIEKRSSTITQNEKSKNVMIAKSDCVNDQNDDDDNSKTQKKDVIGSTTSISSGIVTDNIERRMTRSVRKSILDGSTSLEISPIKKTKKSKKSFVPDSDSDDNDVLAKVKISNHEQPEKSLQDTIRNKVSNEVISSPEGNETADKVKDNNNIDLNTKQTNIDVNEVLDNTQRNLLLDTNNEPEVTVLDSNRKEVTGLNNSVCKSANNDQTDKQILNASNSEESGLRETVLDERLKETVDGLDSSFGIGDLEMFSDNIICDPVVENINALIADLDNDLDSSKNTETNSHFTKELNLETMLENLSSPEKRDKKELTNELQHEKSILNKSIDYLDKLGLEIPTEDHTKNSVVKDADNTESKYSVNFDKVQINFDHQLSNPDCSVVFAANNVIKDNSPDSLDGQIEISSPQQPFNKINNNSKQHNEKSKGGLEDTCSNEAIVSTSEDGNIHKPEITFKGVSDKETVDSPSTPDSTINSNDEDIDPKIVVPHNNESNCEMNSDITSTHASDTANKDTLELSSTDTETTVKIESIGKLLSILQDKSKIKELLSLLGDQDENGKIKKKLEKLSEIVSDDEFTDKNNVTKDTISNVDEMKKNDEDFQVKNINVKVDSITQSSQEAQVTDSGESNKKISNIPKESVAYVNCLHNEENATATDRKICDEANLITENDKNKHINNLEKSQEVTQEKINTSESIDNSKIDEVSKSEDNKYPIMTNEKDMSITKKTAVKKKVSRKGKRRCANKSIAVKDKRLTRSDGINFQQMSYLDKPVAKKPSRELQKLQEDIREMFEDDILTSTGIRMCRIAKLVDEKKTKDDIAPTESQEPLVVLKKCSEVNTLDITLSTDKIQKKKLTKNKSKISDAKNSIVSVNSLERIDISKTSSELKPKNKVQNNLDPYDFDNDSVNEQNKKNDTKNDGSSESECDSLGSSKSFESTELTEIKKKVKRKRGKGWKEGVIKPKNRKKKLDQKFVATTSSDSIADTITHKMPDFTCFTDKNYCFRKNIWSYNCRICLYNGIDIVRHYKEEHPHTEVPLSRMSVSVAKEAIKESDEPQFQILSKLSSKKYVCRFCFKEFSRKKRLLETFFWHIVSTHTGEYKKTCSKCVNMQSCPLDIDIPPPPKDNSGQLLGHICEKCNYTQISLENLKTHVTVWHNNEETAVYIVNLAFLSKTTKSHLLNRGGTDSFDIDPPRVLRSTRSNQSMADSTEDESNSDEELSKTANKIAVRNTSINSDIEKVKTKNIQSKITFESDIIDEISNFENNETSVKVEPDSVETPNFSFSRSELETEKVFNEPESSLNIENFIESNMSEDIFDYPHFKIKYTDSGSKEYVCCINGTDYHYKTTLLISLKKHVQLKHSEKWDGYCCLCKVIVTPQGDYKFKDCLQHFLDKHIDGFPTLGNGTQKSIPENEETLISNESEQTPLNKSYINVRPLSHLISKPCDPQPIEDNNPAFPVIESVISLGAQVEQPKSSPSYPSPIKNKVEMLKQYKYEEFQAEVMSKKHRVVLEAMMSQIKLVQVFKCAGRFCSFTTDNAEHALLHASTHMRVGGIDSLNCSYCDFDSSGNAIDLITHVFKCHGCCPYVCGICFYRATASQLVNAHIKRLHEKATNVKILKTSFQTPPIQEDNILSRESAVSYYLCCDKSGPDGSCKFRTYTPGKFCEHLQTRHASATEHLCFICSTSVPTPADLIRHLKIHGLKLYQCTWCVFGADNETELLEHASALHPARQPKAYLRIITNKEGTSEFRVLPLAQLNKSYVPAIEITPSHQEAFPVREAERSMELEKLIGHTTLMIESMNDNDTRQTTDDNTDHNSHYKAATETEVSLIQNILESANTVIPRISTPISHIQPNNHSGNQVTPIIKTEVVEFTPEKIPQPVPEIVCLDSDDENDNQAVPNVSSVEKTPTQIVEVTETEIKKVRLTELFLCPKCKMIVKCGSGFKKHVNACFASDPIPCAHCTMLITKKNIVKHYNTHCDKTKQSLRYFCQKCSLGFSTLAQVKDHQLMNHSITTFDGSLPAFIKEVTPTAKGRRKRSLENIEKAFEPPEKIKRYGPQDIDKLPINPILDDSVVCSLCEFNTKVRLNMVRHLQLHAQQQPVPQTAPVNPVPHLETNEKHFDKMVNLASSSVVTRPTDKNNKSDVNMSAAISIPPEAVSRYPKYVPDKHRLTCGAKGCSYISVDEAMLKCHWETLHYGTNDFHCVHCPPYQHLDTSRPLTAARIVAHLKMHDETLYACSMCSYYHYKRQILEKHLTEVHKGGQTMIVRESKVGDSTLTQAGPSQTKMSAPTMDLKPWQCGLCKFKSLLRPEVVEHCAKLHNSKMQFKCAYCAFRTSNAENITKHQSKSHTGKPEEIFYFYYRQDSVPDEPDGTTRWQKQSQNSVASEPKVKSEDLSDTISSPIIQKILPSTKPVISAVNLNLVKKETLEPIKESIEDLCKEFGNFGEPNGLKYKCSLCNNVIEDSLEAMQSHLYEELKYRKWGCSICSYKAFHKEGLHEHMQIEHRQNRDPIALPVDNRIEIWVAKLLEHQTTLMGKYKENLAKQKVEILRANPGPSVSKPQLQVTKESSSTINPSAISSGEKPQVAELEKIFGSFGVSANMSFCCPKCNSSFKEEDSMHSHLESELNKIRWFCSNCCLNYQTYHEAQFHCRSVHIGQGARPVEVTRDASVRLAWIEAAIRAQKITMDLEPQRTTSRDPPKEPVQISDNSLLVVRYEENIPNPEAMARKTSASAIDSDDEKLVIDEPLENRIIKPSHSCPHCTYVALSEKPLRDHILRHFGLKPFSCPYCGINGVRKVIEKHQKSMHPTQPINLINTPVPNIPPSEYTKKITHAGGDPVKLVCLVCRQYYTETESQTHTHDNVPTTFGKKGEVVVQCSVCFTLHKDVTSYLRHHKLIHSELGVNYVFSKLNTVATESKELLYACGSCSQKFSHLKDMKIHADANHQSLLKYTLVPKHNIPIIDLDEYEELSEGSKRKNKDDTILPPSKRTARKSTTKLPNSRQFARKSTTKLPHNVSYGCEEFSYYGTKPSNEELEVGVVTMMPFCNKMVPFTLKRLREIININPEVMVEKTFINS